MVKLKKILVPKGKGELNVPVHFAYSLPGIFHQMTSKYFICNVSSRDFNCFTSGFGAKIIMLGHGMPIKMQSDHYSLPPGSTIVAIKCYILKSINNFLLIAYFPHW